ncbi:MAG: SMI1 / KNR4 family protein [Candidatus Scalindua rubra]|uniref:SMI1 / KNR4 family protein n=1 Tax=Candidatus Scalindua rubra TaxID=1872076 RepID=A0A1E3X5G4_9BACT|nr:MAG: SMI1 / KNR4 family protein [Candidatus Scalindua rubra]
MNTKWKYVESFDKELLTNIEEYFNIKLPEDYKKLLETCNRGKPEKEQFDVSSRKKCVLDYLIDLNDVIKTSKRIKKPKIIPIGNDPFGNVIGFKIGDTGKIECLVFWDHETKSETIIAKTFSDFLKMLY